MALAQSTGKRGQKPQIVITFCFLLSHWLRFPQILKTEHLQTVKRQTQRSMYKSETIMSTIREDKNKQNRFYEQFCLININKDLLMF